jgi:hypothetical protein
MEWQGLRYSLRVWLTAAVIGAVIIVAVFPHGYEINHKETTGTFLLSSFYITMLGLLLSVPGFLLCLFLVFIIRFKDISVTTKKIILCCSAAIFIYLNMKIIATYAALPYWVYTISACSAILFFKLKTVETKKEFQF